MLDSAVEKINVLIALDMGPLVDKGDRTKERVRQNVSSIGLEFVDEHLFIA